MSAMLEVSRVNDEAQLVEAALAGSGDAFAEIVRRNQATVRAFLARFVRQADAADDLAQEVFLAAFRSLGTFESGGSLPGWLLGIARHRALHFLRTETRRLQREGRRVEAALNGLALHQLNADAPSEEEVERELAALRRCLQKLPEHGRRLVDAYYFRNESAEHLAQRLGRNGGAVRMMLLRIRRALAECIRRKLQHGE
jgi:RNA polymerase sigma-70 factor (ECF subfamily)